MDSKKKHRAAIRTRFIVVMAMTAFLIFFSNFNAGWSSNPYKKDMKTIPFTEFNNHIVKGDVEVVYYNTHELEMYIQFTDGSYAITANPESYNYKTELLQTGVVVKDIQELYFGEEDDTELKHICNMVMIATWVIFMITALIKVEKTVTVVKGPMNFDEGFSGFSFEASNGDNLEASKEAQKEDKSSEKKVKTFADIAGLHEVKEDIKSLVDFITNKDKYVDAGAKLPKGVILYGPPGTGKTLIAKAIAGESNVPFLYMAGSDFIEMYVGVGAKRVRELFTKARKQAPCIVFIDEIDSIGSKRANGKETGEDRKTINALLTEMDGFNEDDNIIVIGATNRLEDLDPALMRPGRFTDKFCVPLPETVDERKEVLKLYMRNKRFGDDVVIEEMARETYGFSPAQIEFWLNEAAIMQVQQNKNFITKKILDEAMSKMLLQGHLRKDQSDRDEAELKTVSWHEAGHAILGKIFGSDVSKVTILSSTSGAGGVTFSTPKNNRLLSIKDMEMKVMELYAGRLAELILHNGDEQYVTTGASNDIERATELIHSMVVSYGMSKEFGMLNLEKAGTDKEYIIDKEIEIAIKLRDKALKVLEMNKDSLKRLANKLLEKNTVYGTDIDLLELKYPDWVEKC